MQGSNEQQKPENSPKRLKDFSPEEQNRLVGAFVWLVNQDKKQNPQNYQIKKTENND